MCKQGHQQHVSDDSLAFKLHEKVMMLAGMALDMCLSAEDMCTQSFAQVMAFVDAPRGPSAARGSL